MITRTRKINLVHMEKGVQKVPYQCTRYLKENAKIIFLNHNVTVEIEKRKNSSIFSKTGRIYSDSRISYIERESEVLENFGHVGANISKKNCFLYSKKTVFLQSPSNHIIQPDWKNNNCESMNHKIKMLEGWIVSKIPDLIDRI